MIRLILNLTVLLNVSAIYYFRNYTNSSEKVAFFSGITGLVCLPLAGLGLLLGATNIQGVHGDLGGYAVVMLILFFATCVSAYELTRVFVKKADVKNTHKKE